MLLYYVIINATICLEVYEFLFSLTENFNLNICNTSIVTLTYSIDLAGHLRSGYVKSFIMEIISYTIL